MVVVVAAVSKASSGRAWQSSSSYLSLYSILRKNEFVLVSFFGVFLVLVIILLITRIGKGRYILHMIMIHRNRR